MALQRRVGRLSVVAAVAAVVGVGGVAQAATTDVTIGPTATLKARGAAVITSVVVQCPRGFQGGINVQVSERVSSSHVTNGFGGLNITCTGSVQTFRVPAASFDRPFQRGVAFAQASLGVFNPNTGKFLTANAFRTIKII